MVLTALRHVVVCVVHTSICKANDPLQYALTWTGGHDFDHHMILKSDWTKCTKNEVVEVFPRRLREQGGTWSRSASQIHWARHGENDFPIRYTRRIGAAAFGNNKENMRRAFAFAGVLRSIVFKGRPNRCDSEDVTEAVGYVASVASRLLPTWI